MTSNFPLSSNGGHAPINPVQYFRISARRRVQSVAVCTVDPSANFNGDRKVPNLPAKAVGTSKCGARTSGSAVSAALDVAARNVKRTANADVAILVREVRVESTVE